MNFGFPIMKKLLDLAHENLPVSIALIFPLFVTGRAPALIDSWDQALLTAPLFVLMEILFFFGYRKEFYAKIMQEVESNISAFQQSKNK